MESQRDHGLVFYVDRPLFDDKRDFVADIPASIIDRKTLFGVLFEKLQLPAYFGFNWDALSECLRDLSWIEEYRVILFHHDLPKLTKEDLSTYLDVLAQGAASWKAGEEHQLVVAFPKPCEGEILNTWRQTK